MNRDSKEILKLLLEESLGEINSAFELSMNGGYQTVVEIKILPKCRAFFVESNKSKRRSFEKENTKNES